MYYETLDTFTMEKDSPASKAGWIVLKFKVVVENFEVYS